MHSLHAYSSNFSFSVIFTSNPTNFENRYALEEKVIVIPEVARFSGHLIYAMFSSRALHMVWFASIPRHIYPTFKNALIQQKNKYTGEQLDLLLQIMEYIT